MSPFSPLPESGSPRWYRYLRFWRRDIQADIDAEIRFHFDARIAELVESGLTPAEARARAIADFGDVREVRGSLREIDDRVARRRDRAESFDVLRQDLVYAARSLRRSPGLSLTVIITLALGLGVNAAMFSLLDVVFLRPPAGVADAADVRRVWSERQFSNGTQYWSGYDYRGYVAIARALGDKAVTTVYQHPISTPLAKGEDPPRADVSNVASNYFGVLGLRPLLGR